MRQLLAHSSGLPWWRPWFERAAADPVAGQAFQPPDLRPGDLRDAFARGREILEEALWEEPLEAPPGTRTLYGDPAFLALGLLLERAGGAPLDRLFEDRVAGPLGLGDTFFVGPGRLAVGQGPCSGRIYAPTERCPHRGEVNRGTVNDDNAWARWAWPDTPGSSRPPPTWRGSGRSGRTRSPGRGRILDEGVASEFARRDATPGSERALGWDTPSAGGSSIGSPNRSGLGRGPLGAIGHLGYTGCSLWIDRDRGSPARCSRTTSTRTGGAPRRSWRCGRPFTTRWRRRWRDDGLARREAGSPHRRGGNRNGLLRRHAEGGRLRGDRVGRERLPAHVHPARALGHRGDAGIPRGEPGPGPARPGGGGQRRTCGEPGGGGRAGARPAPRLLPPGAGRALHRAAPRGRGGGHPRQDHRQRDDGVHAPPRGARPVVPGGRG